MKLINVSDAELELLRDGMSGYYSGVLERIKSIGNYITRTEGKNLGDKKNVMRSRKVAELEELRKEAKILAVLVDKLWE